MDTSNALNHLYAEVVFKNQWELATEFCNSVSQKKDSTAIFENFKFLWNAYLIDMIARYQGQKEIFDFIKEPGNNQKFVEAMFVASIVKAIATVLTQANGKTGDVMAAIEIIHAQFKDIVLRIKVTMFLSTGVEDIIGAAYKALNHRPCRLHILIDMDSILGEDPAFLESRVEPYIRGAAKAKGVASITLAGGSFPYNLTGIDKGTTSLRRIEWFTWLEIRKKIKDLRVIFGDYAVTNPKMLAEIDPTKINPSAAIRYALKDKWMLLKAGGTRKGGFSQYNDLCKLLILDEKTYSGREFSYGDGRYDYHANTKEKTGNLTTWRRDATSHHLVLTARNCAKLL